jgi:hypothetical protein
MLEIVSLVLGPGWEGGTVLAEAAWRGCSIDQLWYTHAYFSCGEGERSSYSSW